MHAFAFIRRLLSTSNDEHSLKLTDTERSTVVSHVLTNAHNLTLISAIQTAHLLVECVAAKNMNDILKSFDSSETENAELATLLLHIHNKR
jgi:hypothetical protein